MVPNNADLRLVLSVLRYARGLPDGLRTQFLRECVDVVEVGYPKDPALLLTPLLTSWRARVVS